MADFILSARTMNLDGLRSSLGAETYDVDLSHSGRKIARKPGESKGGERGPEASLEVTHPFC